MNKLFFSAACLGLVLLTTGCSSTCRSWSPREMWNNRPTPVRNLFTRGKACSTCNTPAGQLNSYSANYAPGCENGNCSSGAISDDQSLQPIYGNSNNNVPYYPSDSTGNSLPAPGPSSSNTIRTNYPPTLSNEALGSGLQLEGSAMRTNAELETPPMYGSRFDFN